MTRLCSRNRKSILKWLCRHPRGTPPCFELRACRSLFIQGRGAWSRPRDLGDGVHEWTWTAPRELGSGLEKLTATWKQGKVDSSEEIVVELSQGPVRSLKARQSRAAAVELVFLATHDMAEKIAAIQFARS